MRIAVLSGKGGTGKTFISTNLALVIDNATYIDCDVEEPDGELYFKPKITQKTEVSVKIPTFVKKKCTICHKCEEFCAYHALVFVKEKPMLFTEVCHSCSGCSIVCDNDAIIEIDKKVGTIRFGNAGDIGFISGEMEIGQASGMPIIRKMLSLMDNNTNYVIDCPPGSGCMVMETIKSADYCILVAEPTEYGRHNLEMVYELTNIFNKPYGVILNKCIEGRNPSEDFCKEKNIDIIGRIMFEHKTGYDNGNGNIVVRNDSNLKHLFEDIYRNIRQKVKL